MAYHITSADIMSAKSRIKDPRCRLELLSWEDGGCTVLDTMEYCVTGSYTEDAESDSRRSFSVTLLQMDKSYTLGEYQRIWVDKRVRVYIGYADQRTKEILWYCKGIFIFSDCSSSCSASSKEISVSCTDLVCTLDGTTSGQLDTISAVIPAGSVIRDAMIQTLTQLGGVKDYRIDDIGVYSCLEGTSTNYLQQRAANPAWNQVPYDLEFDTGCTVWEMLTALRDLYPGFEMFFDEEGVFICQRIPDCDGDELVLSNEIIDDLVISESTSVNINQIKNVTRIYGKSIETDRFSDAVSASGSTYHVTLDDFQYKLNTVIGILVPTDNAADMQIAVSGKNTAAQTNKIMKRVTKTTASPNESSPSSTTVIYEPYEAGFFQAGQVYCFQYTKCMDGDAADPVYYWVYQGQFQVEALYRNDNEDSPFCVQKIGERIQVLNGGEYDAIYNNDLAMERASYETWKSSRLTDSITLELYDIPFLCVNQKVSYTPQNEEYPQVYMIKSISESFGTGLMTITMMKFYRLYPNIIGAI